MHLQKRAADYDLLKEMCSNGQQKQKKTTKKDDEELKAI